MEEQGHGPSVGPNIGKMMYHLKSFNQIKHLFFFFIIVFQFNFMNGNCDIIVWMVLQSQESSWQLTTGEIWRTSSWSFLSTHSYFLG